MFIKEFQNIIAERLLSSQTDFTQEVKVLRLLKKRFGEPSLQNCDVMMKDIQDSTRVDTAITKTMKHGPFGAGEKKRRALPNYHTKILSRLFWPTLEREHFLVPSLVSELQSSTRRSLSRSSRTASSRGSTTSAPQTCA